MVRGDGGSLRRLGPWTRSFALALVVVSVPVFPRTGRAPVVRTAEGALAGAADGDLLVFKGIRYASAGRWRRPWRVASWANVRLATAFGPACFQPPYPASSVYAEPVASMSEDCLSLNVWTPAHGRKMPVIVWMHGGALQRGSNANKAYDGAALARHGIMLVEINYRLGVLGYLAAPALSAEVPEGVSGNYGLLDQIEALRWVRRNAAVFGGNPENVTIMGESAGGLSVVALMASPLARGLFAKAIAQSAYLNSIPTLQTRAHGIDAAEATGGQLIEELGANLAALRALDAGVLTERAAKAGYVPSLVTDGWVLRRQLVDTFERGEQARVPLLVGYNDGEIRTLRQVLPPTPIDAASYRDAIVRKYGDRSAQFLTIYPPSDVEEAMLAAARDGMFGWSAVKLARSQSAVGSRSYLYLFDHGYAAADAANLHAFHASEVPYVFGAIEPRSLPSSWPAPGATPIEKALSAAMMHYWTSFARTGRPFAAGAPTWPNYNAGHRSLVIANKPTVAIDPNRRAFDLNDAVFAARRCSGDMPWGASVGVAAPGHGVPDCVR